MAYRLDWKIRVSWVPGGVGLGQQAYGPIGVNGGPAQSIDFFSSGGSNLPNSNTFVAADITNLLNTLTTDASTQMNNAATIARIQNFSTGTG